MCPYRNSGVKACNEPLWTVRISHGISKRHRYQGAAHKDRLQPWRQLSGEASPHVWRLQQRTILQAFPIMPFQCANGGVVALNSHGVPLQTEAKTPQAKFWKKAAARVDDLDKASNRDCFGYRSTKSSCVGTNCLHFYFCYEQSNTANNLVPRALKKNPVWVQ